MSKEKKPLTDEEIKDFQKREEERMRRLEVMDAIKARMEEMSNNELFQLHGMIIHFKSIVRYFELTKLLNRLF